MNAETRNVNELFSGTKTYRVRLYQRHYVWKEKNWEELWRDIKKQSDLRLKDASSAKKHFTGNIIIQPEGGGIELLDGQQRLITFQIILCAIRDIWKAFDNTEAAERVQRLIENEGFDESEPTERYKLLPREGSDRETFFSIVEQRMVISDEGDEIQEAYRYFWETIEEYVAIDSNKLNNLYRAIVDDFTVVQIEVTSDDEYARIFELIRGDYTLDAFDLLRNHLFLRAGTGTVRDELYRTYWPPFEEYPLWRKNEAHLFLAHFLKAKGKIENSAILAPSPRRLGNRLYDVYQAYRRELSVEMNLDESNLQFVKHEFQELDRYAQVYQEIRDRNSEIGSRLELYDSLRINRMRGDRSYVSSYFIRELRQFILYIKNELGVSDSLLTAVFDFMESLIVQFAICTGEIVDSPLDLEVDEWDDGFEFQEATWGVENSSIFYHLESYLLSNVLDINMRRNNLSSKKLLIDELWWFKKWVQFSEFNTQVKLREFTIFPPEVVEKALSDYRQDYAPTTSGYSHLDIFGYSDSLIYYILYEIELIIAKEQGFTETDFNSLLIDDPFSPWPLALKLFEHYPKNIGNLTVCPSLWEVNDEWEEIIEREIKLIAYFNKRWPSIGDCLDAMIQPAKCELIGTDEGIKELSQIVVHDTHIEGIDRNDNQRVVLDKNSIFFTCAAAAWSRLKPYIQEDAELKERPLALIELNDQILSGGWEVMPVTRSGHVLRGEVRDFNEDAIRMEINGQDVIVFKQGLKGLYALNMTQLVESGLSL